MLRTELRSDLDADHVEACGVLAGRHLVQHAAPVEVLVAPGDATVYRLLCWPRPETVVGDTRNARFAKRGAVGVSLLNLSGRSTSFDPRVQGWEMSSRAAELSDDPHTQQVCAAFLEALRRGLLGT